MAQGSLEFHIEHNDYFGTVATVLDLVVQDLNRSGYTHHTETLAALCDELVHLQQHYHIEEM
jgi:hypothetical protein